MIIKLKDILNEASVSPSFKKMRDNWKVLEDILGPQSDEYFKLVKSSVFRKWWDSLKRGAPEAIELFPTLVKDVQIQMKNNHTKLRKAHEKERKEQFAALKKFTSMGKNLKI